MVSARAGSEATPRPPAPGVALAQLQARLQDTIATARAQGRPAPTVAELARTLGVDTDLVLLALGTASGRR